MEHTFLTAGIVVGFYAIHIFVTVTDTGAVIIMLFL
jgi:hypothetical protein